MVKVEEKLSIEFLVVCIDPWRNIGIVHSRGMTNYFTLKSRCLNTTHLP